MQFCFFSCMDRCWCHTMWWQKWGQTHWNYTCLHSISIHALNNFTKSIEIIVFSCLFHYFSGSLHRKYIQIYKWYSMLLTTFYGNPKTSIVCFLQSATNSSTRPFPITKNPCLPGTLAERCSWAALQHASGHGECCRQGTVATHH